MHACSPDRDEEVGWPREAVTTRSDARRGRELTARFTEDAIRFVHEPVPGEREPD